MAMRTIGIIVGLLAAASLAAGAAAEPLTGTLAKVQAAKAFVIGFREASPPFSQRGANGKPDGYSIELCRHVAEAVKRRLETSAIDVRYVAVTSANRFEKLRAGEIDIECGSTSHTLARREMVDFSYVTFLTGTRLMVRGDSAITGLRDLDGRRVAATRGTTGETQMRKIADLVGVKLTVVPTADHDEGVRMVRDGKADAFALDEILLVGLLRKAGTANLKIVGEHLTYDPYALVVRKDDGDFRLLVDRTLADLLYMRELAKIHEKWFGPLGVTMGDALKMVMAVQMHAN